MLLLFYTFQLLFQKGFDIQAPRPYTMAGTFSSMSFRNVLVSRSMAWSLVASLPMSVAPQSPLAEQSVLLNLMIQRISWETSGMIGFLPSLQHSARPACPSCEINSVLQKMGGSPVEELEKWRCESSNDIISCLKQLQTELSTTLGIEMTALLDAWLEIFSSNRFSTPKRLPLDANRLAEKDLGRPLQLTAAKSMHNISPGVSLPENVFASKCKDAHGTLYTPKIPTNHQITDILLVIIFNVPQFLEQIPLLEYMYGRHFKHRLYCTDSLVAFQNLYASKHPDAPVNFLEVIAEHGDWGYECAAFASRIGYQVAGYLQIGDDVLLNAWNLYTLPRGMPWFQKSMRVGHLDHHNVPDIWRGKFWGMWPSKYFGRISAVRVYNKLQTLRKQPGIIGKKVSALLDRVRAITGCNRCFMYEASDIFYIPAKIAEDFSFFADVFARSKVHMEVRYCVYIHFETLLHFFSIYPFFIPTEENI